MFSYLIADGDYIGNSMLLTLNPENDSVPVPVSIMSDALLEENEIFLGSLSIPVNPPSGLGPSPIASTTTITILDDESKYVGYIHTCMYTHKHYC